MECHKPHVFFYAEDSGHRLGEGVWPRRSRIRNVSLFLGIGAEEECTVPTPPVLFIMISSGVQLPYWQRPKRKGGARWDVG